MIHQFKRAKYQAETDTKNVQIFAKGLDEYDDRGVGQILTKAEKTMIFGKLYSIQEVHRRIHKELRKYVYHWREDHPIGRVYVEVVVIAHEAEIQFLCVSQAPQLQKVYPPFVNSYDQIKETILRCDANNQRFHAFLQMQLARKETQRQSLVELLIRPVQRLPSTQLLLTGSKAQFHINYTLHLLKTF